MTTIHLAPITVVIPAIPPRQEMYARALNSVRHQYLAPSGGVLVEMDHERTGSAATCNRALVKVTTPWVAFLDDDDWFLPKHLQVLYNAAVDTGAEVVYSGCEITRADGTLIPHEDHLLEWGNFGEEFDPDMLRRRSYLPVTSLVRTDLAQEALFGPPEDHPDSEYDDWGFYVRLLDLGATFQHVPERTWVWDHHGKNTSGRSDRW